MDIDLQRHENRSEVLTVQLLLMFIDTLVGTF